MIYQINQDVFIDLTEINYISVGLRDSEAVKLKIFLKSGIERNPNILRSFNNTDPQEQFEKFIDAWKLAKADDIKFLP